jgi:flavin-binding protein dodecin
MNFGRRYPPEGKFTPASVTVHGVREVFAEDSTPTTVEGAMSIVKIIEVIAQSNKSFDDAAQQAVREVAKTVRGVKSVWIDNFSCTVDGERITEYRVNAKVSFLVEASK